MRTNHEFRVQLVCTLVALPLIGATLACRCTGTCVPEPPEKPDGGTDAGTDAGTVNAGYHDRDYRFVIPRIPQGQNPPPIDGDTTEGNGPETGWTGAAWYTLEPTGSSVLEAQMAAIGDANNVYLYVEAEASGFNQHDVVVVGLHPTTTGSHYHRLHIFPCKPTSTCPPRDGPNPNPPIVEYYLGSHNGTEYEWKSPGDDAGVTDPGVEAWSAFVHGSSSPSKWSVEIKIPASALSLPASAFYGMYVNVAETNPDVDPAEAEQYTWPPGRLIGAAPDDIYSQLHLGTPQPAQWGYASRSTAFGNGVYILSSDIRTNQSDPSEIALEGPNMFFATAHNNLLVGNTLTDAADVTATFTIANWGLPSLGSFAKVPVTPNPTAPATVPATGSYEFEIGPWALSTTESNDYQSHTHQCIRVTLSSNNPNTVIWRPTAMANMQFVDTNSPFERSASVGTKGYELPAGKTAHEFVLREAFFNVDPALQWTSNIQGAEKPPGQGRRYSLQVPQAQQETTLVTNIDPPAVKIAETRVSVGAGAAAIGGQPVTLAVHAGDLVTVLAQGSLVLRQNAAAGTRVGPNGGDFLARKDLFEKVYLGTTDLKDLATKSRQGRLFALPDAQSPARMVGALVGSWDGFNKSSFLIGQAKTVKAPPGARALYLAINDIKGGAQQQGGQGFQVRAFVTPTQQVFAQANPVVSRDPSRELLHIPTGANLPTWIMRGSRRTGKVVVIEGKSFDVLEPVGSFGYIITQINSAAPGPGRVPKPTERRPER
ncbi:MAG: hypothetical protein JW940_32685 [Polyangiaceae bacterium]|nr:hypothetical protein [Polyangiaceae bacterium]